VKKKAIEETKAASGELENLLLTSSI